MCNKLGLKALSYNYGYSKEHAKEIRISNHKVRENSNYHMSCCASLLSIAGKGKRKLQDKLVKYLIRSM